MPKLGIKIEGLQQLKLKLKKLRPEIEEILSGELEAAAENIERMAKEAAPNAILTAHGSEDMDEPGNIRTSLAAWQVGKLHWEVGINRNAAGKVNDLAGYLEFGTGKWIDIPPGLEAYAMMWYKTGKGQILPTPFLFPAVERERKDLIERLKRDLENL